jgi:hypothetical protein
MPYLEVLKTYPAPAANPCDCEDNACVHVPSKCGDTAVVRLVAFGCATYRCDACAEGLRLSGEVESERRL